MNASRRRRSRSGRQDLGGCRERLQSAAAGITDRMPGFDRAARGEDPVTADYVRVTGPADLFTKARELSVGTMILDAEPLVTP